MWSFAFATLAALSASASRGPLPNAKPAVPGSGFAQKLPYRCQTCCLAPSKPSSLLCSFQRSPCQLWPPQLWASCGHARQRLRAEVSLPLPDMPFGPLKTLGPSLQRSPCQLWPPQIWASCGHARQRLRAEVSLPLPDMPFGPLKNPRTFSPAVALPTVASPDLGQLWPRQAAASCRSFLTVARHAVWPPKKPSDLLSSGRLANCGLPRSGPAVATPGSGFAQKFPHRCQTCRLAPSKPSDLLSSGRLANCGLPSSGPAVATPGSGFAQKFPYRCQTCRLAPSKPSLSLQLPAVALPTAPDLPLGPLKTLEHSLRLPVASGGLASCGHARQRLRAEVSLPLPDMPFGPLKTLAFSAASSGRLANCARLAAWPPQNPRTFSAASSCQKPDPKIIPYAV